MSTSSSFKIAVCGDINIQFRDDPEEVFSLVKDYLDAADVRLANLEMCLSNSQDELLEKRPRQGRPAWTQSDSEMVRALTSVSFDVVTTANNVTFGADPIAKSLATLDRHHIAHTGSGANREEARRPAIITTEDGTRLGLLGYTCPTYPRGHVATDTEPGVAAIKCRTAYEPSHRILEMPGVAPIIRSWPDANDLDAANADIMALREEVDVLIAYFHMGVSFDAEVAEYQRLVAHAAVESGADLVFGASAHVPQAVEVYQDTPIFYGLGNFAFDWWFMSEKRHGMYVECDITDGKVARVAFRPVTRTRDEKNLVQIVPVDSVEGKQIVDDVIGLSGPFSTRFDLADDGSVTVLL